MSSSKLFEPLTVGRLTLDHRIVMAGCTRLRNSETYVPLPMAAEYFSQRASVPGGLLITESAFVAPANSGMPYTAGIWSQEQMAGWKSVTDAVHANGGFIFLQISGMGRIADPSLLKKDGDFPYTAAGDIPVAHAPQNIPRPMNKDEIDATVEAFAKAARNAISVGFDGVEVQANAGYLLDQFLQDVSNNRSDKYGGSVENRARFPLEVVQAVVDAIGHDRVGVRLSPFNKAFNMGMADPYPQFIHLIQELKPLHLAYLHFIQDRPDDHPDGGEIQSIDPFIKEWGRASPIFIANGYNPEKAKEAVDVTYADKDVAIAFARHFIANPDLPYRIKRGLELNPYDRDSFYTPMQAKGYTDYPFHEAFAQQTSRVPTSQSASMEKGPAPQKVAL